MIVTELWHWMMRLRQFEVIQWNRLFFDTDEKTRHALALLHTYPCGTVVEYSGCSLPLLSAEGAESYCPFSLQNLVIIFFATANTLTISNSQVNSKFRNRQQIYLPYWYR